MFKTIEEGLAVFEDMNLKFSNDSFQKFIKDLEITSPSTNNRLIDRKIFKVYIK